MTTVIEGIEVLLGPHSEDYRKTSITVRVHSKTRYGLRASKEIDPADLGDAKAVMQMVGVAAGAGAEYLNKHYKDDIAPHFAAKTAIQALGEEVRLHAECGKDFPVKLARVRFHVAKLKPQEIELLERMEWRANKGLTTPSEVLAVDTWIARIHANQLG